MLTHQAVWQALDQIARHRGLSPSGMAKRAGLDPTTFNRSKRITREGRSRWPSTESIAKVLEATDTTLAAFVDEVDRVSGGGGISLRTLPALPLSRAAEGDCFSGRGEPEGEAWEELDLPLLFDGGSFILEIDDASMAPVIREGDLILVATNSGARRGDRVVVRTKQGELLVRELVRRTVNRLELIAFADGIPASELDARDVAWIARIVCIAQFH